MALLALLIGVVLIVAAIRDTHTVLFSSLTQDLPPFMVWGAAVFAVGAIGWIPGLSPVSRGLLALVLVVIVLRNYESIIEGLSQPLARPGETVGGDVGSMFPNLGTGANTGSGDVLGGDVGNMLGNILGGLPSSNANPWILH